MLAGLDRDELYERMAGNLVASWRQYAEGSPGASVEDVPGAAVGIFPAAPEREIYNNALLERRLDDAQAAGAVEAVIESYGTAGVSRYAVWAHELEAAAITELSRRGFAVDTWTRAMAMSLDDLSVARPQIEVRAASWEEHLGYLRAVGVPPGLLSGVDGSSFHVLVVRHDARTVATAIAYDHNGDCGIYNMGTLPDARRRGLGAALTAVHLHEARERGCATASLQATAMAERIYAGVGFSDLGRFIEYVPPGSEARNGDPES